MNSPLYKQVHLMAVELLKAADEDNAAVFNRLYAELQALCEQHEQDVALNHPVQWETLADFTEDHQQALALYSKALMLAEALEAREYVASIAYASAQILLELDDRDAALERAIIAKKNVSNSPDKELKSEINSLLASLK